jgi:hypothetical protein
MIRKTHHKTFSETKISNAILPELSPINAQIAEPIVNTQKNNEIKTIVKGTSLSAF